MWKDKWVWVVVLCPLLTVLFFTQNHIGSPNDTSRMATIQSMVEYHTLSLDSIKLEATVDIQQRDGHYYSDKPPMMQVLGAIIYYPLHHLLGWNFKNNLSSIYYTLTLLLVGIPYILISLLLYNLFRLENINGISLALLFLLSWLGTLLLSFSITFNNHIPAAFCILAAIYIFITTEFHERRIPLASFWMGFLLSLALTLELPPGGLCFAVIPILLYLRKRSLGMIILYLAGAIIPLVVHFYFNYLQVGDLLPAYLHKQYYNYPGTVWGSELGKKRLFGKSIPGQYFHMLFGYRGIFLFAPILILGFIKSIQVLFRKTHPYRGLAFVTLIALFGTISSYAIQISDFGGGSYGLRWVIAVIPLLIFFTGLWLKDFSAKNSGDPKESWMALLKTNLATLMNKRTAKWGLVVILLVFSILFSAIGLYNPWPENVLSPCPILENIAFSNFHPEKGESWLTDQIVQYSSLEPGLSYYELARACWDRRSPTWAVYYYSKSLKYDPSHTLTYYNMAIVLDQLNRPDLAIPLYVKLLEMEPDNVGGMNNLGISLLHLGKYIKAEEVYRKSIELDPHRPSSYLGLARSLAGQGKLNPAFDAITTHLTLNPSSSEGQELYLKLKAIIFKK